MVGPGEVDEDLEGETFEECGKYGKVIKCLIFEVSFIEYKT
jgi:splicing factor 45